MTLFPLSGQIPGLLQSTSIMLPVLKLFLLPVGGGIPAGVLLARAHTDTLFSIHTHAPQSLIRNKEKTAIIFMLYRHQPATFSLHHFPSSLLSDASPDPVPERSIHRSRVGHPSPPRRHRVRSRGDFPPGSHRSIHHDDS